MHLSEIGIRGFRNLTDVVLSPHPRFNVLAGPNGAGKTNILEAIYVLGNVRSFRVGRNRDLVQVGADRASVMAGVEKFGRRLEVQLELEKGRKRFRINQDPVPSFADYLGTLVVVVFSPSDITLLRGSSGERRRFVDRVVCGAYPAHLADLQDYERVLRERNQLLKEPRLEAALLEAYSEQMVPLAARITARRVLVVEALGPRVGEAFAHIFSPELPVELVYDCRWWASAFAGEQVSSQADELAARFTGCLAGLRRAERQAGFTLIGPHRDDLSVGLGGLPVREYASQGQTRALVLALKVTEISYLEEMTGDRPVLLLDDVSSELDQRRNTQLFEWVGEMAGQTFITTTDRQHIQIGDELAVYQVAAGEVTPV